MKFKELREKVYHANMRLPELDLVVFTWGNASEVDRKNGVFAIKPSGVDYDKLTVDDMVVISLETGEVVAGELKPSSDTPTHLALYRAFPDVKGIVHTHSPWGVAWAQSGRNLRAYGTTHADTFYGDVPCTRPLSDEEMAQDYEENTGKVIIEKFNKDNIDPNAIPGVLVKGHGPFAWGSSADNAVYNARVLEEVAKMAVYTETINPEVARIDQGLLDRHYMRKHGKNAYYGQK